MEFLANPIRLRIIAELRKGTDLSASQIATSVGSDLDPEIVTLHLHLMEDKGLVEHHFGDVSPDDPNMIEPCYRLRPEAAGEIEELKSTVASL